jgi:1-acyl-sn-glycerol-3-phosphate acyltransferase
MRLLLERTIAWVRTLATLVLVSAYILLVGPPGIALALAFNKPIILYRAAVYGVFLGFFLSGVRYRVEGDGALLLDRAAVYCVNHSSNVEPPVLFVALRRLFPHLQVIYKKELRRIPILPRCWDIGGFVPIDRKDRIQSDRAIEQAAENVRAGKSFLVFPEGTRSRTGELLPFKKGAFILAIKAQAPIVPIAIVGANKAMRKGSPVIWPATLCVRIDRPVETAGLTLDDRDRLSDEVRARIGAMLATGPCDAGAEGPAT